MLTLKPTLIHLEIGSILMTNYLFLPQFRHNFATTLLPQHFCHKSPLGYSKKKMGFDTGRMRLLYVPAMPVVCGCYAAATANLTAILQVEL